MDRNTGSTRDKILRLLKQKQQRTITEMAGELDVTEMAVRRHMSKLEKDGLIDVTLVRQHVGRPMYVYYLSPKGEDIFPKHYKEFSLEMLEDLQTLGEEKLILQLLEARTERTRKRLQIRLERQVTTMAKLKEIGLARKQDGYMATVEVQSDGVFVLKKQNCPLLSVAQRYPSLCRLEEKMYQDLVPCATVTAISCASDKSGTCIYEITSKP